MTWITRGCEDGHHSSKEVKQLTSGNDNSDVPASQDKTSYFLASDNQSSGDLDVLKIIRKCCCN